METFINCPNCKSGILLPLSDYGGDHGGSVKYKAWVCYNEKCGWTLRIDKGQVSYTKTHSRS